MPTLKDATKNGLFIEGRRSEQKVIWKIIIIAISNKIHYGFFPYDPTKNAFHLETAINYVSICF